jgi:hypothetical protein
MSDHHSSQGSSGLRWGLIAVAIIAGLVLFLLLSRGTAPVVDLTGSGKP